MDKEEIDAALAQANKRSLLRLVAPPTASWLAAVSLWPTLFLNPFAESSYATAMLEIILASLSFGFMFRSRYIWLQRKRWRALTLWNELHSERRFFENTSTKDLWFQIGQIYQQDACGEFFPLPQALRLIDTHHRQQQRSNLVVRRLYELQTVHTTLSEKIKQLRALGADSAEGEQNLLQIEADTAALKTLKDQIEASCRRLEMILLSVETAFKTRQLQREISELGSRATNSAALSTLAPENELSDIERQIGREIETFLQLERETERHFG